MKARHKRLLLAVAALVGLGGATALGLGAVGDSLVYFRTPGQLANEPVATGQRLRLGGLVETGSVERSPDGLTTRFRVTDNVDTVRVAYTGLMPDLFREGQGVVADGRLDAEGLFVADQVLAKHDENYMPREVKEALEQAGEWRPEAGSGYASGTSASP